jgi:nitrite reductase/ring-hydroxylating ferredoxin subunit
MKDLKVGPGDSDKVLISRIGGKLYAVGNACTHFGFGLNNGMLVDDKVVCPLHSAAFNVTTGAIEHAPGVDGLPKFDIIEKDGKSFVKVPLPLPKG